MPISSRSARARLAVATALLVAAAFPHARGSTPPAAIAVIHNAPWSPDDPARDGAGEFAVLVQLAQLQRHAARAGLLGVGAPRGVFATGTERALRFAVLSGVAVAKLAPQADVAACPDGLFIDAGALSEADARALLAAALVQHGPPPRAANPTRPTPAELAATRAHVRRLQALFRAAPPVLVARR